METPESTDRPRLVTPTRISVVLGLVALLLMVILLVVWPSRPSSVTLDITAPVGQTVVCHVVVDGQADSYEDVAPVTYHFEAHDLSFAVVCMDATAGDVSVSWSDQSGSGGTVTDAGVTGKYTGRWWGSALQNGSMTPTHVTTMRTSVVQQKNQTGGNEENEVPSP